jgi:hypothetical protein
MTNPSALRCTGFIRDIRTPKRNLYQTLSQVFFLVYSFSIITILSSSQQQLHRQLQLKYNRIHLELVHHQHLLLMQFTIKHHKNQI